MTTSTLCPRQCLAPLASVALVLGLLAPDAHADRLISPDMPLWRTECGSCHVAYPPALLSAPQWRAHMSSLARHYGTDASVDAVAAAQIGAFLERNAGRDRGIATVGAEPPRITASAWFVRKHREVRASEWRSTAVKSPPTAVPATSAPTAATSMSMPSASPVDYRSTVMNTLASPSRILVWDLPLRMFHWLFAGSFAGAFLTAESERWRDVHAMLGYTVLALVAFRIAWGFIGPRHARFTSFAFGPSRVLAYLRSLANRAPMHYTGHNPAGSWAIYALLAGGLAAGVTGLAVYNDAGGRWLEHLHEFFGNAMLGLVAVHVMGVIGSSLLHRENLVRSMITGYKTGPAGDAIGTPRRVVAVLLGTLLVGLWAGVVPAPGLGTLTQLTPVKVPPPAHAYSHREH